MISDYLLVFLCIPIIAYFDYLLFGNANMYYRDGEGNYKKIEGNEWYVATFLEVLLFLAGVTIGVNIK